MDNNIFCNVSVKENMCELQALISERDAWISANYSNALNNEQIQYTEEDFLDMAVAFRQLVGGEINME